MTNSKRKINFTCVFVILFVVVASIFLMGGCVNFVTSLAYIASKTGYKYDRIIFTDNLAKYMDGATLATYMSGDELEYVADGTNGSLAILTDKEGYIDIICDVTFVPNDANSPLFQYGLTADMVSEDMQKENGYRGNVLFECSYMFSGKSSWYKAGGGGVCDDPACTCIPIYDSWDKFCSYQGGSDLQRLETTSTNDDEIRYMMGLRCPACDQYYEESYDEETGLHTYVYFRGEHGVHFEHDGTFKRDSTLWTEVEQFEGEPIDTHFNELILEYYDFSYFSNVLTNFEYDKYYTNWQGYYNPTNFSHMFSDLPVEKIVIGNVTGLGDNVKDLSSMFENCPNLTTIEFGNFFDNIKPTNISRMFYNCPKLTNIDLSGLDTSNVTNMSMMFALTGEMTGEMRDSIVNDYINTTLKPNMSEVMDPNTDYTLDSFVALMNEVEGVDTYTRELILFLLVSEMDLDVPLTYDEACLGAYNMSLVQIYNVANTNPEALGLASKTYSLREVIDIIKSKAAEGNVKVVYDADLWANTSRDEYINYFLNHTMLEMFPEYKDGTAYTLDTMATKAGYSAEQLLFMMCAEYGMNIPMTYEEMAKGNGFASFDEVVVAINNDPASYGLQPKGDGSDYTVDEVKSYFKQMFKTTYNIDIVEPQELDNMYAVKIPTTVPDGKLTLGGNDSKFVIKSGTLVTGMFIGNHNFGIIITPKQIEENIEINLVTNYTDGVEYKTQTIGKSNSNMAIFYNIEEYDYKHLIEQNKITPPTVMTPAPAPKGGLNNTILFAVIFAGSAVAIVIGVVIVASVKRKM